MDLLYDGLFDDVPEELKKALPSPFAMMGMSGAMANLSEYGDLEPVVIVEHEGQTAVQRLPEWDEVVSKWVPLVAATINARLALGGGDHALLITDTYIAVTKERIEPHLPLSENPEAREAVLVFEVKGRDVLGAWTMIHGRDDKGETTVGPWETMPTEMESEMMDAFQLTLVLPLEKVRVGEELMREAYPDLADGLLVQDS